MLIFYFTVRIFCIFSFFHFILLAPSFLMACFSSLSCLFAFSSASFIPPLFVLCFRAFALSCRTSFFSLFIAFTFCLTGSIPPYFVVYFLFYSSPRSCTFLWYFYRIFSLSFLYIYIFASFHFLFHSDTLFYFILSPFLVQYPVLLFPSSLLLRHFVFFHFLIISSILPIH